MLKASLLGHIGRDAETRHTPDGSSFTSFTVACNGPKKDAPPTWVDCTLSGQRGERLAPHLKKGTKVLIHGNLSLRTWQGRDGTAKTGLACLADYLEFAGGSEAKPAAPAAGEPGDPPPVRNHPGQQGLPGVPQPPSFADDDSVPF